MAWQTQAEAKAIVEDKCAYLTVPALTATDIDNALARTQHASVWAAVHTYAKYDVILPTVRNGVYMMAVLAGISAASEPAWPVLLSNVTVNTLPNPALLAGYPYGFPFDSSYSQGLRFPPQGPLLPRVPSYLGTILTDGTVRWQVLGPDWASPYDTEAAIYEAWLLKAAKAVEKFDFSADGQNVNRHQLYDHCIAMAQRYAATL